MKNVRRGTEHREGMRSDAARAPGWASSASTHCWAARQLRQRSLLTPLEPELLRLVVEEIPAFANEYKRPFPGRRRVELDAVGAVQVADERSERLARVRISFGTASGDRPLC